LKIPDKELIPAVPKLFRILNTTRDEHTKINICEALGRIGSPKEKIADVLVGVLSSDPSSRARVAAACALRDLQNKEKNKSGLKAAFIG